MSLLQASIQLKLIDHFAQSFSRTLRRSWRQVDKLRYDRMLILWRTMIRRCTNPTDKNYRHYGGRGIKVDQRWLGYSGFTRFILDVGVKPEKLVLDRIDNDGNYTPGNCRWTSYRGSANNRRDNRRVTVYGVEMSLQDACRIYDIHPTWAHQRLYVYPKPWTPERTFTTPTSKGYQEYVEENRRTVAKRKARRRERAISRG